VTLSSFTATKLNVGHLNKKTRIGMGPEGIRLTGPLLQED